METVLFFCALVGSLAFAEVQYEGYFKIENSGNHVGFALVRTEFDCEAKTRTFTNYVKTTDNDKLEVISATKTVSDLEFHPLNYKFEQFKDGKRSALSGEISKHEMIAKMRYQDKTSVIKEPILVDNIFEVESLPVLALAKPVVGKVYVYKGIDEEDAKVKRGQIRILEKKDNVVRVLDDYGPLPIENWITDDGQLLYSRAAGHPYVSHLVATLDEATEGLEFNRHPLVKWFGEIPSSKKNPANAVGWKYDPGFFSSAVDTKYKRVNDAIPLKAGARGLPCSH